MQFINYFFISIISFLGLLIGIMLVKIAPEEQKPLQKYFILLRKILLLLIFVFVIFYYINDKFNLIILFLFFIFSLLIEYKINQLLKKSIIIYLFLGILFFFSSKNINLFIIESSLIMLYGLPTASLLYNRKEKFYRNEVSGELKNSRMRVSEANSLTTDKFLSNQYKIIFYNMGFIIIANILYFI